MALGRRVARGLRRLLRRDADDRDIADELTHYLDEAARAHEAGGLTPDAARRAALVDMGSLAAAHEQIRSSGWEHLASTFASDLRYAARGVARRPALALVTTATLAMGIGASTAIFSAVYPILFAPLPYPHADRLVILSDWDSTGTRPVEVTYETFTEVAARSHSFAALAAVDRWQPALTDLAEPERLVGLLVTADYFRVLGVSPVVGRGFTEADDRPDAPHVAIISNGLVRRRFNGYSSILGRQIRLDGNEYTVVGILPPAFDSVLAPGADVWAPRRYRRVAEFEGPEWGHHMRMIGRLTDGIGVSQATNELAEIGRTPRDAFPRAPWAQMTRGLGVEQLQAAVTRDVRPALVAIMAAVALLLVIAGVNVTNLLVARGAERQIELAMRAALGAGRGRLIRQLLTESLLLAALGGAAGLGVATVLLRTFVRLAPAALPRVSAIGLDLDTFAFAVVLTTILGLLVGLVPALQGARRDLRSAVHTGTRTAGTGHPVLRRALVGTELGLALVVLVGAGLMLRTVSRLLTTPPGFDASHVLTMKVAAVGSQYDSDEARYRFFEQALLAVREVPGVTDAAFTSQLPLSGDQDGYGVQFEDASRSDPHDSLAAERYAVTSAWFRAMGIPLRRGRLFDDRDRREGARTAVISESLARAAFPAGTDPLGQRLRAGPEIGDDSQLPAVVVGVVGDVKQASLALGAESAFYVPMGLWPWVDRDQSLVVRTNGDPAKLAAAVRQAVWSVDRHLPIVRVSTMEDLVARSEAQRRFVLVVFEAFGLAALALAGIGVYGMMSTSVTERTRELGVRTALGASRRQLLAMVMVQGLGVALAGAAAGLGLALLASRFLMSLLFGVSPLDLPTYAAVVAVLLVVSAAACARPAWRAARVDPLTALRSD